MEKDPQKELERIRSEIVQLNRRGRRFIILSYGLGLAGLALLGYFNIWLAAGVGLVAVANACRATGLVSLLNAYAMAQDTMVMSAGHQGIIELYHALPGIIASVLQPRMMPWDNEQRMIN